MSKKQKKVVHIYIDVSDDLQVVVNNGTPTRYIAIPELKSLVEKILDYLIKDLSQNNLTIEDLKNYKK